jgi:YhcN/YlaJ family sporulation lipoprotein
MRKGGELFLQKSKKIIILTVFCLVLASIVLGCTAQRRPNETPTPPPPNQGQGNIMPPSSAQPQPIPTESATLHQMAQNLANQATKVNGVKEATVVITGNTALVGVDLASNTPTSQINTIQEQVATNIKQADSRITNVSVTADADMVTKIKNIGQGIAQGKPITTFTQQIDDLMKRIGPAMSGR